MTKRLLSFALAVVTVFAFFVIDAGAAIDGAKLIYQEDFTRPEGAEENWAPQGWALEYMGGTASKQELATARITEEGYIELNKGSFDGVPMVTATMPALPADFTLMYDLNNYTSAKSNWVVCSLNGYNQTATGSGLVEFQNESGVNTGVTLSTDIQVWYTYVFQISGDRMSVYRKERDSDGGFVAVVENVKMKSRAGHVLYAYAHGENAGMYIDNVKIFAGTYVNNQDISIVENGNNKKIVGTMNVTSANTNPSAPKPIIALLGIYDQRGRVIDMVVSNSVLSYGDGNEYVLSTREYSSEEFQKMIGNTVEMYIWESFSTMTPQKAIYSTMLR